MSEPYPFVARRPRLAMPPGACDCHTHVFTAYGQYPLQAVRAYTPSVAMTDDARRMMATLGTERLILVQPSVYGTDNACMLDVMAELGPICHGVVVLDDDVTDDELDRLHGLGVRGVRLNVATGGGRDSGALARASVAMAKRIARLGWHIQYFTDPSLLPDLVPVLADLPVAVVIDHMGKLPIAAWESHPGTRALFDLLATGRAWVKLSGAYRVGAPLGPWDNVAPLAQALHAARPDRMVWGSDWPHPQPGGSPESPNPFRPLDTGALLDLLADWVPDAAARRQVLVDNPARLYDFADVPQ